jgi:dipeptidyl aminopeptidase/acylaminoacyl peptidase
MAIAAQEQFLTLPSTISVVGVPPIPASIKRAVESYGQARAAELLAWHPVRREMLIATAFGNVAQIHLVKSPEGSRSQLTFFGDRPTSGVSYQPTRGEYFLFRKDAGGDGNFQIYRFDVASNAVTLLTDGRSRNSAGTWSRRGDRIAFTSTRRTGRDADLYVMSPTDSGGARMVAPLENLWLVMDWSPDDRQLLMEEYVSINESYLWLVDVESGQRTLLTPKGRAARIAHHEARFTNDGSSVYVLTDQGGEFQRLAVYDASRGSYTQLTAGIPWDVYEYRVSPDGRIVAVVSNEEGFLVLRLIDAQTGVERPVPGLRRRLVGVTGINWHRSGRWLGLNLDSEKLSTDAYALEVATGRLERWTLSETGAIDTRQFVAPELVRWESKDGRTISGFLYRPPARFSGKRPVLIDVHGGPESQWQPYFLGPQNYLMNELGIAVLFPNIRGSSGYGKSFLTLDDGPLRENAYQDIAALLDWIQTQPGLDADRVMVSGFSYGGHVALIAAARHSKRLRGVIAWSGPANLATFLERTAPFRRDLRRAEYGDEREPDIRAFFERTAPSNNVAAITVPVLVIQGANDPAVPSSEAEQFVQALRPRGVPVWYMIASNEGHGYVNRDNRDFQFYAMLMFLRAYLLD